MRDPRFIVTVVLSERELDGLDDPILIEDLGDGYGLYELSAADSRCVFGLKSAPTDGTHGEEARPPAIGS